MALRSNTSRSMGELLLKGWCMCAESCPECQIPLMRDPKTKSHVCVSCDAVFPEGADLTIPPSAKQQQQPAAEPPSQQQQEVTVAPANGTAHAAGAVAAPTSSSSSSQGVKVKEQEEDKVDSAELIAQKLVQGWAMLDKYCPRCSTVLVREKKSRRMFCVQCDLWVMTEEEAQKAQGQAPAQQQPQQAQAPVQVANGTHHPAPAPAPPAAVVPAATARAPAPAAAQQQQAVAAPSAAGAAAAASQPVAGYGLGVMRDTEVSLLKQVGQVRGLMEGLTDLTAPGAREGLKDLLQLLDHLLARVESVRCHREEYERQAAAAQQY